MIYFPGRKTVVSRSESDVLIGGRQKQLTVRILKDIANFLSNFRKGILVHRNIIQKDFSPVVEV